MSTMPKFNFTTAAAAAAVLVLLLATAAAAADDSETTVSCLNKVRFFDYAKIRNMIGKTWENEQVESLSRKPWADLEFYSVTEP